MCASRRPIPGCSGKKKPRNEHSPLTVAAAKRPPLDADMAVEAAKFLVIHGEGPSLMSEIRVQSAAIKNERVAELVEGIRSGDSQAFGTLYQRFGPMVHGILLLRVGSEDAEDLTQEVFLKLHRNIDDLQDGASLPAWICKTARNLATDHQRQRSRQPVQESLSDLAGKGGSDDRELAQRVLHRVRLLPEAYQETLIMRLVEGLTGPEISACTGLTQASVRVSRTGVRTHL